MYGAGFIGTFAPYIAGLISDQYGIRSAFLSGGIVLIIPILLLSATRFPRNSSPKPNEINR
jgi:MFS family permease